MCKSDMLRSEVEHIDITRLNAEPILKAFRGTAFQARNLGVAAEIYTDMLEDVDCTIILCLAGSLFSAGLKKVVCDLVHHNMVDVIVSTGAIMVDQDFFEALGFRHYQGTPRADDSALRTAMIDRIYDTYIDEEQLRICDETVAEIADRLVPRPYSSQEFLWEMGQHLAGEHAEAQSVLLECWRKDVPVFVPAFSDCSAGFGLVLHQKRRGQDPRVTIDSAKDFLDLTRIKIRAGETGLLMIGGGVPKNFAQDVVVAAELLGEDASMHKYAVQITVADERDGGLSGSTLKEAHSWGKVDTAREQMVFCEATIAFPLLASCAYHSNVWSKRQPKSHARFLQEGDTP